MNKTTVKVLQLIIRKNNRLKPIEIADKLNKTVKNIYFCLKKLEEQNILNKKKELKENKLTNEYKKLFIKYPYDFSFLTTTNMKIISQLTKKQQFFEIISRTNKSRFSVHKILKELRTRGFVDTNNEFTGPEEIINIIEINKNKQKEINLPSGAFVLIENDNRKIIQTIKKVKLDLYKTAFSAMKKVNEPSHNYYTTQLTKPIKEDIIKDALEIQQSQRERNIIEKFRKND